MSFKAILLILLNILSQTSNVSQTDNIQSTRENNLKVAFEIENKNKNKERKIAITLESVLQISNDHVGGDWSHFLSVDKKIIKKGETEIFVLQPRAPLSIIATSVEEDKDFPDSGGTIVKSKFI